MRVRDADRETIAAVLRRSHEVWGEGLTVEDYITFNLEQKGTAWGRERYRFLVAEEGGAIVAAMKLYTLPAVIDGRPLRVAGVGAVFTLPEHRGRGHGRRIVEAALASATALGHDVALLMSEIDGAYYERLGFRSLPALEAGCLPFLPMPWAGEPAWLAEGDPAAHVDGLRPFRPDDLEALVAIREEATRGQRFRLRRDRPAWEQALFKAGLRERLAGTGGDRIWVVERGGTIDAYVALRDGHGAVQWREHGGRLGAEEALADLFWFSLGHARRLGVNRLDAWHLPAIVTTGRRYPIALRPQRNPVIMVLSLHPGRATPEFAAAEDCRLSWLDQF
jgi:predicted N-acetyltransferase YhbS